MIEALHQSYQLLAKGSPATQEQIDTAVAHFGSLPREFVDLIGEATEVEIKHRNGQYIRIWGPRGCIDMDEGYGIGKWIPGAIPIGDDGGCRVLFYAHGNRGYGLYDVGYGNLDMNDAIWIAATLAELLMNAKGLETL